MQNLINPKIEFTKLAQHTRILLEMPLYTRGMGVFNIHKHTQTYTIRASTYTQHTREIHIRVIVPNMGIVSSQRGNKKKLGYLLTETRPLSHSKQATYSCRRVCCVYVEALIVYVCVPLVYVDFYKNPFIYRAFRHFSCMLRNKQKKSALRMQCRFSMLYSKMYYSATRVKRLKSTIFSSLS